MTEEKRSETADRFVRDMTLAAQHAGEIVQKLADDTRMVATRIGEALQPSPRVRGEQE